MQWIPEVFERAGSPQRQKGGPGNEKGGSFSQFIPPCWVLGGMGREKGGMRSEKGSMRSEKGGPFSRFIHPFCLLGDP
jgi:hypothetical protein